MQERVRHQEKDLTYYEMLRREQGVNHRLLYPADKAGEISKMELQLQYLKDPKIIEDNYGANIFIMTFFGVNILRFFNNPIGAYFDWFVDDFLSPLRTIFGSGFINGLTGFVAGLFLSYVIMPCCFALLTYIPWHILYEKVLKERKRKKYAALESEIQKKYEVLLNDGRDLKSEMIRRLSGGKYV